MQIKCRGSRISCSEVLRSRKLPESTLRSTSTLRNFPARARMAIPPELSPTTPVPQLLNRLRTGTRRRQARTARNGPLRNSRSIWPERRFIMVDLPYPTSCQNEYESLLDERLSSVRLFSCFFPCSFQTDFCCFRRLRTRVDGGRYPTMQGRAQVVPRHRRHRQLRMLVMSEEKKWEIWDR